MFPTTIASIGFLLITVSIILLIRNEIVYCVQNKARQVVFGQNTIRIDAAAASHDLTIWHSVQDSNDKNWEILNHQSYHVMVVDLTKWTFKQFYPQLVELESNQ